MQTENLTILLTDIVGFSNKLNTLSRLKSQRLLKKHDRLLKKYFKLFGGKIVKSLGDAFLVTFRSPTDATLCAMAVQDAVWEYNQTAPEEIQFDIRVAINSGEVRVTHKDIFGDAVNIVSRLEAITPDKAIYLTESVYLSMHKTEVSLSLVGAQSFKGFSQALNIYEVDQSISPDTAELDLQPPFGGAHIYAQPAAFNTQRFGKLFVGIVAAIIAAFFTWWLTFTTMVNPSAIGLDKLAVEYQQPQEQTEETSTDFTPIGTEFIQEIITQEDQKQQQLNGIYLNAFQLLSEDNYLQVRILLKESLAQFPDDGKLQALKAHAHLYFKEYDQGMNAYQLALKADSTLADDELFAKDLVMLLEKQREAANQLIAFHLSPAIIEFLHQRTGQKGLRGRYDAFYLLRDSGNQDRIDRVGLNIWDLRETEKCSQKKTAVLELKRLADPQSLDALKEATQFGFLQSIKNACFWDDAKEAIALIEAKQDKEVSKEPSSAASNEAALDNPVLD